MTTTTDPTVFTILASEGATWTDNYRIEVTPNPEQLTCTIEIITADEQNWLHGLEMQLWTWFKQFAPREWSDVYEGIAATVVFQLFRVFPSHHAALLPLRLGDGIFDVPGTAAGGGVVKLLCTDGQQLYYISGTGESVVAADPSNGDEIWEKVLAAVGSALTVDGRGVYYMSATQQGLRKIDRNSGDFDGDGGTEFGCTRLRANGVYCVGVRPSSDAGRVVFWTVATPTETGTQTPTTLLEGVAIDAEHCYVGGTRNTNDIWCYKLSDRSLVWQIALDTNAPTVRAITADGDFVYVATEHRTLSAGGSANLFCLSRYDGELLWTANVKNDTVDLYDCAVDDRYLYVIDEFDTLIQIRLRVPTAAPVAEATGFLSIALDGVSVAGASGTDFRRVWVGGATKTMMRVAGNDPNRRPFYNLAVPTDGRI